MFVIGFYFHDVVTLLNHNPLLFYQDKTKLYVLSLKEGGGGVKVYLSFTFWIRSNINMLKDIN